ncbi:hypothetical protein KKB18_04945, partial [bacterium]|nr:hypothetical protein [bacterium]
GEKLPFLSERDKIKDFFFNVILFPELEKSSPSRIIILDDFENIAALGNFYGFKKIEIELLESLNSQKNSLYIVSLYSRSMDDVFFTDDVNKALKKWNYIEIEPLSFPLSSNLISNLLGYVNSNLIDDICLVTEGIPAYIQMLVETIIQLHKHGYREYSPENFALILSNTLRRRDGKLYLYLEKVLTNSLSRVRGSTSLLSCLKILSSSDELLLKDMSKILSRSPQAIKDYLDWLIKSGLIEKDRKTYKIRDILMKLWILLNSTGQSEIKHEIPPEPELMDIILCDMEKKRKNIIKISPLLKKSDEESPRSLQRNKEELIEFD